MKRSLTGLALTLAVAACSPFAPAAPPGPGSVQIENVPFHPQRHRDDCGPAALASLLDHRGFAVGREEIREAVYDPRLGGSLLPDLENYARDRGAATRSGRGDLELLRRRVAAGSPVLIPIETGFWVVSRPHYLVIYGFERERFLAHAGERAAVTIEAAELDRRWAELGRLYLYLE